MFVLLSSAKSSSPYVTQMSMALHAGTYTVLMVRLRLRRRQWTSYHALAPFFHCAYLIHSIMCQVRSGAEPILARPTYGSVIQLACTCLLHLTFFFNVTTYFLPTVFVIHLTIMRNDGATCTFHHSSGIRLSQPFGLPVQFCQHSFRCIECFARPLLLAWSFFVFDHVASEFTRLSRVEIDNRVPPPRVPYCHT